MVTVEYVFILLCMADVKLDVNVFRQRRVEWLVVMDNEKATFVRGSLTMTGSFHPFLSAWLAGLCY
jgi:hypothetical protein